MRRQIQDETTLVLGGTGKTGRRVVERLRARGLPVRVGSRSGEPPFDWEDRSTWATALEGAGSVYISHYLDAIPGARRRSARSPSSPSPMGSGGRSWWAAAASPRPSASSRRCGTPAPS